ncbi:MAG: MATE family efflux transporter [Proteobacteria bacterium]|nr:MATE family efflux transporter [Pseudomonadota bacterium]
MSADQDRREADLPETVPDTPNAPNLGYLHETGHLLKLALPLMGAQLAQMGMGVTDAVMAGRYSSVDLAGVALGGSLFWPIMMLIMGLVQAVTPTVSQLNGARRYSEIGEVIRQGLWIALAGGIVASLLMNNIEPLYHALDVDPAAVAISVPYLHMTSLGVPALMCFFCLRFLADGMGFTKPALYIAVGALICKIPLNYALIYGKFGLPEMGGVGCGVAQAILMWVQLGLIVLVVTRKRFDVTGWRKRISPPDWQRIKRLLIIGVPIGATIFAEMGLFSLTTLLLGQFGSDVVASHNIAMNINGVLFMPALALGMAATIRIGFRVGAGEIAEARTTAGIAMAATIGIAVLGCAAIYFLRGWMVSAYTVDPAVAAVSTTLLLFVVFFLVFDASQSTSVGALRGYKDTRIPMYIALFSYWVVGLPLECILGFGLIGEPMGVYGFWIGLSFGVGTAAFLLCYRLWRVSGNLSFIHSMSLR